LSLLDPDVSVWKRLFPKVGSGGQPDWIPARVDDTQFDQEDLRHEDRQDDGLIKIKIHFLKF
jgi:hypothetical protein